MTTLYTIGHSNHTWNEFLDLLQHNKIKRIVDVRTIPRSRRYPWFSQEMLKSSLLASKIYYTHMPELGGLRHAKKNSINMAWKNESFRGYADYMQTKPFFNTLFKLNKMVRLKRTRLAILCAEALPWKCHRSLISDAEVIRRISVYHIVNKNSLMKHSLTKFAKVNRKHRPIRVFYPK